MFSELKEHFWYSFMAILLGMLLVFVFFKQITPYSYNIFYIMHPLHVFFSAYATVSLYRILSKKINIWKLLLVVILAAVLIPIISDSLIPYYVEFLFKMPSREVHIGFIEEIFVVNGALLLGVVCGAFKPIKHLPHFWHVLVSSFASVLHVVMSNQDFIFTPSIYFVVFLFLVLGVWIPCVASDIVVPVAFKD
ncbi:MAG: hypothetical protein GY817_07030 [bacterium]|nr:hypothetical protein [bacterium]